MRNRKNAKFGILTLVIIIGLVPILVSTIVVSLISRSTMEKALEERTSDRLRVVAQGFALYYQAEVSNTGLATYNHDYVDKFKNEGIELSLYLGNKSVMKTYITSIIDAQTGERIEGEYASDEITEHVSQDQDFQAKNVEINGSKYYVYYVPIKDSVGKITGMASAAEAVSVVNNAIKRSLTLSTLVAGILMLVFAGFVVFAAIAVKKPIARISYGTVMLAQGKLGVRLDAKSRVKEIDALIEAASTLQTNLHNIIETVNGKSDTLNGNVAEISDNVSSCNRASEGVVSAVEELSRGSMDMAESVQNTAMSINDIGEDIDSITALAKEANDAAIEVKEISNKAKQNLEQLLNVNGETVEISKKAVEGILEASTAVEEIRQAADVITGIASQTKLLSLNASIEAARAGESGRGFAVVASSIQGLAEESDKSTNEIRKIIENIISKSENNVKLANQISESINNEGKVLLEVSESFDEVNSQVEVTAEAIESIAERTEDLNRSKNKVVDEISTLSSVSQQNAASCEETNASMEELSANMANIDQMASDTGEASEELKEAVAYFRL